MTWAEILLRSAVLLNDSDRQLYTDAALLPYLNMSLTELEEIFELHNLPVTNEVSDVINVPSGTNRIGFDTTPALPADLVEIQELFESVEGNDIWIPVTKRNFLTSAFLGETQLTSFILWSWRDQAIHVRASINDIDIKINYIKSLFPELTLGNLNQENSILGADSFLYNRIAGLAAEFIGENETRAASLNGIAVGALDRSLGISIKGQQSIVTRRRPFRAAYKRNRIWA